jgi:hypothetical protein
MGSTNFWTMTFWRLCLSPMQQHVQLSCERKRSDVKIGDPL